MRPMPVGIGVALRWVALYVPLIFITQIWSGDPCSPWQGGWPELAVWAGAFGVIAVAACMERAFNGSRVVDPGAVMGMAAIGHGIGAVIAVAWFASKGGPSKGDWFIAPAVAAVFVVVWVHLLAVRLSDEYE